MMFRNIDDLKKELLSLEPMKESDRRRMDEKFRLEFNYNSNHMEGNTLTYQDTKVLLLKDILPQSKVYQMRELEEMKAHDVAYAMIQEWAADPDREITERDIRDLNKIILVKDFYKDAITQEGSPTRKLIKVGEYKETPNSVLLSNGEIFHYADPIDVPAKMQELLEWYRSEKTSLHPITLASVFHHKFVLIHPFDDGNGRLSRLLMNYILLKNGFPPVIIKSAEKQTYLNALRLADAGDMEAFIKYISEQLEWSLELAIKAARGKEITEPNDWEKELSILAKQEDSIPERKTANFVIMRFKDSFFPMIEKLKTNAESNFNVFFKRISFELGTNGKSLTSFLNKEKANFDYLTKEYFKISVDEIVLLTSTFLGYKKNGLNVFNIEILLEIHLKSYYYSISFQGSEDYIIKKMYNEVLTEDDNELIKNEWGKMILENIKKNLKK
jgi:Fic family protein